MFGFITPTKSNLIKEDIEKYKAYYCGLCHVLNERYGKDGRNSLSYDMTFLSLLLTDLYNAEINGGFERCIAKPLKEHKYIISPYTGYSADMQMMLSYYSELDKAIDRDEDADSRKLKGLKQYIESIEKEYPRQAKTLKDGLTLIRSAEKDGEKDPGKMSCLFGSSVSEVFNPVENDFFSSALLSLGSALGRFIYIMDAFTDLKKDSKSGAYNPLLNLDGEVIESLLMNAATDASVAFESLALDDNLAILRNIIYSGMWKNYDKEKNDER